MNSDGGALFRPFPAEILASAGALFGAIQGTILIWIGAMIGAALSFWLARRLDAAIENLMPERHRRRLIPDSRPGSVRTVDQSVRSYSRFQFDQLRGRAFKSPVVDLVWTTAIGILPLTFLMAYMGAEMRHYSMLDLTLFSVIAVMALSPLLGSPA